MCGDGWGGGWMEDERMGMNGWEMSWGRMKMGRK